MTAQTQTTAEFDSTEQHAQALVTLCKASADQLRLAILRVLSRDSFGVLELCNILDYKQSGLSHHLKLLAKAGLLSTRREGNNIFYRRALHATDPRLDDLQHSIFKAADQLQLGADKERRIHEIQHIRAQRSKDFFSRNTDKFNEQQEQIAAYELYGNSAADLVTRNANTEGSVLEVGPGEGAFLAKLSPLFKSVYAVDNSEQMLSKAKAFAAQQSLDNICFIHGDTKHPQLRDLNIDNIVVNMVLHHVPSPAEMFEDFGQLLQTGGRLFITDLCSHDQHWTQDACGDLWLGFEPEELNNWALNASLNEGQSAYLTQLNGFRVQLREFIKC